MFDVSLERSLAKNDSWHGIRPSHRPIVVDRFLAGSSHLLIQKPLISEKIDWMSSYPSRSNRYYGSGHGTNARAQASNVPMPDENFEEMSEDLQKIFDDDSKCARLLKKILREDRSFELRLQRIQEFHNYLEKSDSNKVVPFARLFIGHSSSRSSSWNWLSQPSTFSSNSSKIGKGEGVERHCMSSVVKVQWDHPIRIGSLHWLDRLCDAQRERAKVKTSSRLWMDFPLRFAVQIFRMDLGSYEWRQKKRCPTTITHRCFSTQHSKWTTDALSSRTHRTHQSCLEEDSRIRRARTSDDHSDRHDHRSLPNLSACLSRNIRGRRPKEDFSSPDAFIG